MDAQPYIERVLDDEGLTSGLADDEAKVLLDWLVQRIESAVATAPSEEAASERTRALTKRVRVVAKVTQLVCEDEDFEAATTAWQAAGQSQSLDTLDSHNPVAVVTQLLQWEDMQDA